MGLYDKSKIGKMIAKGGDRFIYRYGESEVIKFSSLVFFSKRVHDKMVHDYLVCKTFFKDYVVPVIDVSSPLKREHIEIQPYIRGEMLSFEHTKDLNIMLQIQEIKDILDQMTNEGHPIVDLVGRYGMFKLRLSNVLVDENKELKIIDTTLMETSSVGFVGYFLIWLVPIVKARQRYILKRFLDSKGKLVIRTS